MNVLHGNGRKEQKVNILDGMCLIVLLIVLIVVLKDGGDFEE